MYITVQSIKKTLGKFIEINDLYVGLPLLIVFLLLFSFSTNRIISLIFLTISIFLLLPVNLSKKNRMYKVLFLIVRYLFRCRDYIYRRK